MEFSIWTWDRTKDSLAKEIITPDEARKLVSEENYRTMVGQGRSTLMLKPYPDAVTLKLTP